MWRRPPPQALHTWAAAVRERAGEAASREEMLRALVAVLGETFRA